MRFTNGEKKLAKGEICNFADAVRRLIVPNYPQYVVVPVIIANKEISEKQLNLAVSQCISNGQDIIIIAASKIGTLLPNLSHRVCESAIEIPEDLIS